MSSVGKSLDYIHKNNEHYISPLQTVSEETPGKKNMTIPKNINYQKTYSNLDKTNLIRTTLSQSPKNKTKNSFKNNLQLPLLIDKNNISTFYRMKKYKVALPKHRDKKEISEEEEEEKVKKLIDRYAISSFKSNNRSVSNKYKNEDKKFDFNSYLKLQSRAEIKFRPKFGDSSLELVNYIKNVASIRKQVLKDILDEIRGAENRFNQEKPEVDSNFKSKDKYLIDNRWKNSFSLEEYQQFFMKNLKGKISNLNYRVMLKKFRQISLMCFSEGNNNYSTIKRLDYID